MAGDWIKMTHALPEKPEVLQISGLTSLSRFEVVGRLFTLWRWFDTNTVNGNAVGVTKVTLNECLFGYSDATNFVSAVITAGWLAELDGGIGVVKFDEHISESAKTRAQTAKRVAKSKAKNGNAFGNAETVTKSVPKEEKRREELTTNPTTTTVVVVASDADDLLGDRQQVNNCPHQDIIALYHQVLPQCPPVRAWTPTRAKQLRARWAEDPKRQSLDYWRQFFEYVKTCPFLVGAAPASAGRQPFIADLEWMTKSANFTKIREQKYEQ